MSIEESEHEVDEQLLALHKEKDYKRCLEACREKLKENPLHMQALLYLAHLNLDQKEDLEECIYACDTLLHGVSSEMQPAWVWKGQAHCLLGQFKEGEECYTEALKFSPNDVGLWSLLTLSIFLQDRKEYALGLLDVLEEQSSAMRGKFTLVRGCIERVDGNTEDALLHFLEGSMQVDPKKEGAEKDKEMYAEEIAKTIKQTM